MLVYGGMLSLAAAAVFIIRQKDYKRMLAYSSVEHMGLIAVCWGAGLQNLAPLHMAGHSLCKMTLFLLAGNFLLAYGTRRINQVKGAFAVMPRNSFCWLLGILMICAVPPSPLFYTEYLLVTGSSPAIGITVLVLLFAVFCGMTNAAMQMTMGAPGALKPVDEHARCADRLSAIPGLTLFSALVFGALLLIRLVKTWN
jgi:hydrogenase-4 component F